MMRRALLNPKFPINYPLTPTPPSSSTPFPNTPISPLFSYPSKFRFFSAENENPFIDKPNPNSESTTISPPPPKDFKVQDVSNNKGLKTDTTIEHDVEFEQMHPKTLKVMRFGLHLLNNPDVLFEMLNDPKCREIADQYPEIIHMLKTNPVISRRALESLRIKLETNPKDLLEMMGRLDRLVRSNEENGQEANSNPFVALFGLGGAAQNQAANPATTGDDLGGAETTTGSPAALSTDPLSNPWAAAGGTANATNPTPDDGVDDVSNPECITFNVRSLNGTNFVVKANLEMSVKAFKSVLAHNCDVPTTEQRLVYKGRVLDDDETLMSYGLEADHTVHLVRGSGGLSWNEHTPFRALGPRGYIF
ncbi:uncharacterized protein [Rutidosis leptorrhynchoides]|uniref:uncharacterized protein n=1 Tax=Rutidosis leptorrhynchoides TaxID=125765 RepID=UPI003A98FC24